MQMGCQTDVPAESSYRQQGKLNREEQINYRLRVCICVCFCVCVLLIKSQLQSPRMVEGRNALVYQQV